MIRLCAFSDEADASLSGQIEALRKNGLSLTELRSVGGKNVKDFTLAEAKEINGALKDNGISVWSVGSPLGKADISVDFSVYEKEIRHVFALANLFNAERIRMFSFFHAYDDRNRVIDRLSRMLELAAEYGVTLCLENEKEVYGDTAARVCDLLSALPELRFVYDPANFLQVGCTAEETLSLLHEKADYFHVKDVSLQTGALVPAGYGDGKIDRLIAMIGEDRDTVLTLEPHLALFEGYAAIDATEMKHEFCYASGREAFDAACAALKALLQKGGYVYNDQKGGYEKNGSRT